MSPLDNIRPNWMAHDDKGSATPEKERGPGKLTFEESTGSLHYGRIPYEIRYNLNAPTSEMLNKELLGNWLLVPDETSQGHIVTMWVHESCPPQYKHIVMYHELIEAELELGDNIVRKKGHHLAVVATDAYAKAHLSPIEFEEYKQWERSVLPNIVARRSKDPTSKRKS